MMALAVVALLVITALPVMAKGNNNWGNHSNNNGWGQGNNNWGGQGNNNWGGHNNNTYCDWYPSWWGWNYWCYSPWWGWYEVW
jgi:hypothetical protein